MKTQITLKQYIKNPKVNERIQELLKDRAQQFIVSLLSIVNSNDNLVKCEPKSLMNAAMVAASLDLPINQNLGFAYIIPYKDMAQFQIGYKGFIQLAQRSGQFVTINVTDVRQGEIEGNDRLTGEITFNWIKENRETAPIVGYVAYMQLKNGFQKSLYMTKMELTAHGMKFSQSMKRGYGLWKDDFDSMAEKTVIKMLLSKYAPLTVDMQKAHLADQSVVVEEGNYQYVDNQPVIAEDVAKDKEMKRIQKHIEASKTITELELCRDHVIDQTTKALYDKKTKLLAFDEEVANL